MALTPIKFSALTAMSALNGTEIIPGVQSGTEGRTTTAAIRALPVSSYTVASVPSAAPAGQVAYITNEVGGATLAFSDGTDWRRCTDLTIISV